MFKRFASVPNLKIITAAGGFGHRLLKQFMPDQNYPGMDDEASPSETPETPEKETQDTDEESNTGLLPKSFFGDKELKPGNQCTVEIVRCYEDECEVKYIKHGDEPDEESPNSKLEAMGRETQDSVGGY